MLTFVQVNAGVDAPVVARGRSASHVVRFFNKQNVEFEARKLSCHGATDNTATDDKHIGFLSRKRIVFERGLFGFFVKAFEPYVVDNAKRAFAYGRFAALVNIRPIVKLSREPYAPAVVFDFDGRGDFIDRPAYLCQIHIIIPLYLFFLF